MKKIDETYRLSPAARDGVAAAVDALHRLQLPFLAGHLHPVIHPEWPASEEDAMTRIDTVRVLLRNKPLVLRTMNIYLDAAVQRLKADAKKEQVA